MFFNKNTTGATTPQDISILGTSALGLYLAAELQKVGHRINIICLPQEADEANATDFIFRDTGRLQNSRQTFNFSFEQTSAPHILLIASEPQFLRRDLLLLSPSKLNNSHIVNFSPCRPNEFISEIFRQPVINAYFNGWLNKDKNHITKSGRNNSIVFSLDETSETATLLRDIFTGSAIAASAKNDNAYNFWHWLAPRATDFLIRLVSGQDVCTYAKTPENRKNIDDIIAEISTLASFNNISLNNTAILTEVYATPDNTGGLPAVETPLLLLLVERFNSLLFYGIAADDRRFPILKDAFRQIRNKFSITA